MHNGKKGAEKFIVLDLEGEKTIFKNAHSKNFHNWQTKATTSYEIKDLFLFIF